MTRTLASAVVDEVTAATLYPVFMTKLEFDGGNTNLWTGVGSITVDSDTFVGVGELGSVGDLRESTKLKAAGVDLTLSGVDSSIIALILTEDYQGRPATIYVGFLDGDDTYIDRVTLFKGRMDVITCREKGEESIVTISVESVLVALERANLRRMTPEDQKHIYPTDTGFDQVPALQATEIIWGKT
jgi:hypothetical protein